jgi:hypothetical protein
VICGATVLITGLLPGMLKSGNMGRAGLVLIKLPQSTSLGYK